jgi:hypothetical protein
LEFGLRIIF